MTMGLGGFQETEQMPIFSKITKYQVHVNNKARMAELTGRAFDRARLEMGPTYVNIPRDYFYGDIECEIPRPLTIERGAGGDRSLDEAAELLASAQFPVILVVAASSWATRPPKRSRSRSCCRRRCARATCTTTHFRRAIALGAVPSAIRAARRP